MDAGLNLFSIRNLIQTEEEFLSVALKLKAEGYSYIQYSGAPYDADKIARVSQASGMPIVLTHVPMDRILNETDALMEEHARFGCKNIGLGAMYLESILDEEKFKEEVAKLDAAGAKMREKGFKFFYHHHHFEFIKHSNGETAFEYMIKNAPNIHFTLDTYWLQYAGVEILSFLDKVRGRVECVHLKDYRLDRKTEENGAITIYPRFSPVGEGNLDFAPIIKKLKEIGAKYFLVEQDDAADYPDAFGEVARSIHYIKKEL